MNIPTHYITRHFIKALKEYLDAKLIKINQVAGGWQAELKCNITKQVYTIDIKPKPVVREVDYECPNCEKVVSDNGPYETPDGNYLCQSCYEDGCERAEYLAECQEEDRKLGIL